VEVTIDGVSCTLVLCPRHLAVFRLLAGVPPADTDNVGLVRRHEF
jgi:hypothetical protein